MKHQPCSASALRRSSLHNLTRLGCLRAESPVPFRSPESAPVSTAPSIWSDEGDYYLTSLATDLLEACEV